MRVFDFLRHSFGIANRVFWTLFKITFPILLGLYFCEKYFALTTTVGTWLSPLMQWVGLPGETGIVFATALLLNLYSALLVFMSLTPALPDINTAQITILMTMILVAHALPVEVRIVQVAGVRPLFITLLRLMSSFAIGYALYWLYGDSWLSTPPTYYLQHQPPNLDFYPWLQTQAKNWLIVFAIIQVLILFNEGMKKSGAEKIIVQICQPFFRLFGIGDNAINMALVGMFLGLSYGGGLLIEQGRSGQINKRDVLCVLSLLCLCHAIIEDTIIVMLVGAHISGVLIGRVVFSLIFMLIFAQLIKRLSDATLDKYFTVPSRV